MSTNRIEGAAKALTGQVKETVGKAVGDDRMQIEGAAEKALGKAQSEVGKVQDKLGDALKR